jgi:DNA primase
LDCSQISVSAAVPLEWDELKGLRSASAFTMKDVLKRM